MVTKCIRMGITIVQNVHFGRNIVGDVVGKPVYLHHYKTKYPTVYPTINHTKYLCYIGTSQLFSLLISQVLDGGLSVKKKKMWPFFFWTDSPREKRRRLLA